MPTVMPWGLPALRNWGPDYYAAPDLQGGAYFWDPAKAFAGFFNPASLGTEFFTSPPPQLGLEDLAQARGVQPFFYGPEGQEPNPDYEALRAEVAGYGPLPPRPSPVAGIGAPPGVTFNENLAARPVPLSAHQLRAMGVKAYGTNITMVPQGVIDQGAGAVRNYLSGARREVLTPPKKSGLLGDIFGGAGGAGGVLGLASLIPGMQWLAPIAAALGMAGGLGTGSLAASEGDPLGALLGFGGAALAGAGGLGAFEGAGGAGGAAAAAPSVADVVPIPVRLATGAMVPSGLGAGRAALGLGGALAAAGLPGGGTPMVPEGAFNLAGTGPGMAPPQPTLGVTPLTTTLPDPGAAGAFNLAGTGPGMFTPQFGLGVEGLSTNLGPGPMGEGLTTGLGATPNLAPTAGGAAAPFGLNVPPLGTNLGPIGPLGVEGLKTTVGTAADAVAGPDWWDRLKQFADVAGYTGDIAGLLGAQPGQGAGGDQLLQIPMGGPGGGGNEFFPGLGLSGLSPAVLAALAGGMEAPITSTFGRNPMAGGAPAETALAGLPLPGAGAQPIAHGAPVLGFEEPMNLLQQYLSMFGLSSFGGGRSNYG